MTRLDDYLEPLDRGIWEVVVPKETVTEPLDPGWKKSRINVPSPGTVASLRKGRFHVHETGTEWRVHLDRYDPDVHPLLHLIDDAPLLLMISDTFMTLVMDARRTEMKTPAAILSAQRHIWQEQAVYGLILVLAGLHILTNPLHVFQNIFEFIIPVAIIGLALIMIWQATRSRLLEGQKRRDLLSGAGVLCAGVFACLLPLALWVIVVLVILALWMIASAVMLLRRVVCGRSAVPEGFYSRMAIGLISLAAALFLVISPAGILIFLMEILGAVTLLLGITLCINGLRLRTWMKQVPAP